MIKIESFEKEVNFKIPQLTSSLKESEAKNRDIIKDANYKIQEYENEINNLNQSLMRKNHDIEGLKKQLKDNQHLVENDQTHHQHAYNEIQNLKQQLADYEEELEQYKNMSRQGPMRDKTDYQKELQRVKDINEDKLQSFRQQIDQWRTKYNDEKQKSDNLSSKLKTLPSSSEINSPVLTQLKDLLDLDNESDIIERIQDMEIELATLEPLKTELQKAQSLYSSLRQQHDELLNNQSQNEMNDFSKNLLRNKDADIQRLEDEILYYQKRFEDVEGEKWQLTHYKNQAIYQMDELKMEIRKKEEAALQFKE
jgi:chromosome segregation ATPase